MQRPSQPNRGPGAQAPRGGRKGKRGKPQVVLTTASTPLPQVERRMAQLAEEGGATAAAAKPVTGLLILLRGLPGAGKTKLAG